MIGLSSQFDGLVFRGGAEYRFRVFLHRGGGAAPLGSEFRFHQHREGGADDPDLVVRQPEELGVDVGEGLETVGPLNRFLLEQKERTRIIFIQRYWYFREISEIAEAFSISESTVKMTLLRTRRKLHAALTNAGIDFILFVLS